MRRRGRGAASDQMPVDTESSSDRTPILVAACSLGTQRSGLRVQGRPNGEQSMTRCSGRSGRRPARSARLRASRDAKIAQEVQELELDLPLAFDLSGSGRDNDAT